MFEEGRQITTFSANPAIHGCNLGIYVERCACSTSACGVMVPQENNLAQTFGRPDTRDEAIGRRIRLTRLNMGMSQMKLAAQLHLSFQQIQKYEKGANSVSARMLLDLASALDVSTTWLLEGHPAHPAQPSNEATIYNKLNLRMFVALSKVEPTDRLMAVRMVERFATMSTVRLEHDDASRVTLVQGVTIKQVSPLKAYS